MATAPGDAYSRLATAIAASARERDVKQRKFNDEQAAKARHRDETSEIWLRRKAELPGVVKVMDDMLKEHGFTGVRLGIFELKHGDIDRVVIEFAHSPHKASKILFSVGLAGDFTCSIGTVAGYVTLAKGTMSELTEHRFQEVLTEAVARCLTDAPVIDSVRPE